MLKIITASCKGDKLQSSYHTRINIIQRQLSTNEVVLVPSNEIVTRNNDVNYPFRQDSDFFYLTGWDLPNALLLISQEKIEFFCEEPSQKKRLWEGISQGVADAAKKTGLICHAINNLEFKKGVTYLSTNPNHSLFSEISCKKTCLGFIRKEKSFDEIDKIKQALSISIKGHFEIMQSVKPGITESELYGIWLKNMFKHGLKHEAYPAIIASGINACTLHYQNLNSICQNQDLLLIDAGVEYENYASDLTRTIPVNKKFTKKQKQIYEHVLEIQELVVDHCKPGMSFKEINQYTDILYQKALDNIGITGNLREYAPHGIGHSLGLDVHDIGIEKEAPIPVNAVLTIEPGLYFKEYSLGVRIEDNYLMTEGGLVCLSTALPKSVSEIEDLCG